MKEKKNWAAELAERSGKTKATIYYWARKLGRKPTIRDLNNVKIGRPEKY